MTTHQKSQQTMNSQTAGPANQTATVVSEMPRENTQTIHLYV